MKPEALFELGMEFAIRQGDEARRVRRVLGPDDRTAAVAQRQDREWPGRQKMLFGPAVVLALMRDRRDDGGLIVGPAVGRDAGIPANRRAGAISGISALITLAVVAAGAVLVLACTFALAGYAGATTAGGAPAARTLLAVGDIASCSSNGDEQTAALVSRIPGTIAVLGDIAYENGSETDFANCFEPSWGKLVPRIKATLGNHEYNTPGAAPAVKLFGLPPHGWYSYSLGAWHVIVLNSNCSEVGGCGRDSPQAHWLEVDLARHAARCTTTRWWRRARTRSDVVPSNGS